jgi:putative ABC transport system permease protein
MSASGTRRQRLMRPYALGYFYRRRLRVHGVQELLAGVGIAVAVALVVSTLIAEGSIAGSTNKVVRTVIGPASLQLRARSSEGFDERLLASVQRIAGVEQAAPLLEQTATITGAKGRRVTVIVAGTDVSLAILDGLGHTLPISALAPGGVGLSKSSATKLAIGSANGQSVTLKLRGRSLPLRVSAVLGPEAARGLSDALAAVMPLAQLQRLASLPGRVTRILVKTAPSREGEVRSALSKLAAGRLTVAAANEDEAVLHQALGPSDQASAFFAGVAAVLGLLFAFTAMLLTVPERRRAVADLRLIGTKRRAIAQMVIFQAVCLGFTASLIGVAMGYGLSVWALHQSTGYLAEAFALGTSTVVSLQTLALALLGGVLATCLASALPLLDLRRGRRLDAIYAEQGVPGNALSSHTRIVLALAAALLLALQVGVVALWPSLALPASVLIALATILAVPLVLAGVLAGAGHLASRFERLTVLPVALASLKATTLRSLVLAATGAVAIFGSVALGGARQDLLRGIERFAHSYSSDARLWVINPDDNQAVLDFNAPGASAAIARVPGVARVDSFQGGFLDIGSRRVWIIARPSAASQNVLRSQALDGLGAVAARRIAGGGWVAASRQLAEAQHVGVGGELTLPTPSGPARFRLAARTTNLAWIPGVIFISSRDFQRYWASAAPTALAVQLRPGARSAAAQAAISRVLGPGSGLEVSTAAARARRIDTLTSEGLGRLGEIAALLTIAAVLAMATALASSVWQRRVGLAGLRLNGVKPRRLRRILMSESLIMLGAGCVTGGVFGLYGEHVIDGYLREATGFPVAGLAVSGRPFLVVAIVLVGALALVAVPGWLASRAPPTLALEAE